MTFLDLYQTYYSRAFRFVRSYICDDAAAEDIVADSMVALWSKFDPSRDATTVQFLFTILKNKSLDYLRANKIKMTEMGNMEQWELDEIDLRISTINNTSETSVLSNEINRIARKTLAELPERTQEIFKSSRIEGKSYDEISKLFGLSTKGVEYHISIALKLLRVALKDYMPFFTVFH